LTVAEADVTARARIRDAAVRRFGAEGFGVPVRAIAAEAGVRLIALALAAFRRRDVPA
jgi:AcrR family transcriptional regulator